MKDVLAKNLQCPICCSALKKNVSALLCVKNKHKFKIMQGIPMLFDYCALPFHTRKQQSYFEKNSEIGNCDYANDMSYWKVKYLERFKENFRNIKGKTVLDIGTGGGYMAIGLAKLGATVIASDITLKNLVVLKEAAKTLGLEQNLSYICCSGSKLPLKKSFFDYVVINSVLEHIPEETKTIGEISRILKVNGGLMVAVPLKYKYILPLLIPLNYFHDKRIGHLRRYDDISLKNKFDGFYMKKIYFSGHPIKVVKIIVNMIIKIFDEKKLEEADAKLDNIKMWSSNVIAFLIKS